MPRLSEPSKAASLDLVRRASIIRATVFGVWLITIATTPYISYCELPSDMRVFRGFGGLVWWALLKLGGVSLASVVVQFVKWLGVGLCGLSILWPNRLQLATPGAFASILFLDALTKSATGYANHAQLIALVLAAILTCFWRHKFHSPLDKPRRSAYSSDPYELIIWITALAIVLPYTFIGINRLLEGGIQVLTGDAILDYVRRNSLRDSRFGFTLFVHLTSVPIGAVLLKLGFAVTTAFEVLSVGVFVWPRFRLAWLLIIGTFHIVTLLSMNILFWENAVLIYAVVGLGLGPLALGKRESRMRTTV